MSCTSSCESASQTYDTKIVQGATFKLVFKVTGINLTGASVDMVVVGNIPQETLYTLDTLAGIVVSVTTPITDQTVTCSIDESNTNVPFSNGYYDVFANLANGDRIKLLKGKMAFEKSIGRV